MRKSTTIIAALMAVILMSGLTFAQHRGGPHHRGPGFPGDTIRPPHGPMDTLGGPRDTTKPPMGKPRGGRVGLKDSCFQVFLTQIPADSAAMITADMTALQGFQAQADTLRHQLFAAMKAKDSAAVAAIRAQLKALHDQMSTTAQQLKAILDQYKDLLMAVRKDCGGMPNPPHKGEPGNGGGVRPLVVTPVIPNPVPTGATASFTYTLAAASDVNITLNDMMGTAVKTVFTGNVTETTAQTVTLDLSGLKPGLYILRVQAGNAVMSQKVMVQ